MTAQGSGHDHGSTGEEGGDWRNPEHVRRFAETIDAHDSERAPIFRLMAALLAVPPDAPLRVLDIGTGLGAAAAALLDAFPVATAVGLDISEEMIRRGHERMAAYGDRVCFVLGDFSSGLPASVEGDFDAIISSIAIHHLPPEGKPRLYAACARRLRPGGALLNLDYVQPPDASLIERYQALRAREDAERGLQATDGRQAPPRHFHGGKLDEHLAWLGAAGLTAVDCFYKRLNLALVGGFRR